MSNNIDTIISIQKKLGELTQIVSDQKKQINALKIDKQMFVKCESPIRPGVATKVAYNNKGLITATALIEESDLPMISIGKINGLDKIVGEKADVAQVERLSIQLNNVYRKTDIVQSGCKVNIDEHGLVVSVADLCIEDIPSIPISKIENLENELSLLRASIPREIKIPEEINVNAGTGCKVTYNNHGHVISSSALDITDIPNELLIKINSIETSLTSFVPKSALTNLRSQVVTKVTANAPITPGVFTKVTVDDKGLVTSGRQLEISDLPVIEIDDVNGLRSELLNTITRAELVEVNAALTNITNRLNSLNNYSSTINEIKDKASKSEVAELRSIVSELKLLVGKLTPSISIDVVVDQLNSINNDITTLASRVAILERR